MLKTPFGALKNLRKYCLLYLIVLLSSAFIFSSAGCNKTRVFVIGIVNINPNLTQVVDGFKSGMAKAGFIEGKNVVYLYKDTLAGMEEVDPVLNDLISKKADLILTVATAVTKKAAKAVKGTKVPVVFAPVFSPVDSGLVKTLVRPGGNLTGIQVGGNIAKALEWHKAIVPGSKRILVPCKCDEEKTGPEEIFSELKKAASKLGIEIVVAEFQTLNDLTNIMSSFPEYIDSIWLLHSTFVSSRIDLFADTAIKRKLPLSTGTSQTREGVLMSYGHNNFKTGEQASRLAYKILDGASPADLPVEMSDFSLTINLKTARAIGIRVPDAVLQQADNIIR